MKPYSKADPNTMVFGTEMKYAEDQRVEDMESLMSPFEEHPLLPG